jgi:hypothetical protein
VDNLYFLLSRMSVIIILESVIFIRGCIVTAGAGDVVVCICVTYLPFLLYATQLTS